jgi:hypothetical protein
MLRAWLQKLLAAGKANKSARPREFRPEVESLEARDTPSGGLHHQAGHLHSRDFTHSTHGGRHSSRIHFQPLTAPLAYAMGYQQAADPAATPSSPAFSRSATQGTWTVYITDATGWTHGPDHWDNLTSAYGDAQSWLEMARGSTVNIEGPDGRMYYGPSFSGLPLENASGGASFGSGSYVGLGTRPTPAPTPTPQPSDGGLSAVRQTLLALEAKIPSSYQIPLWGQMRGYWISGVEAARTPQQLAPYLRALEASIYSNVQVPSWSADRQSWINAVDHARTYMDIARAEVALALSIRW